MINLLYIEVYITIYSSDDCQIGERAETREGNALLLAGNFRLNKLGE